MFSAVVVTITKIYNQPNCPLTDGWIKETWYADVPGLITGLHPYKLIIN